MCGNFSILRHSRNVEELLLESVKKLLVADAPVGALCSGGVDSSLIMAMAAKFHDDLAIRRTCPQSSETGSMNTVWGTRAAVRITR